MQRGPPAADITPLQVGSILRAEAQGGYTGPLEEAASIAASLATTKQPSSWQSSGLAVGVNAPPTAQPDIAAGGSLLPQQPHQVYPTDTKYLDSNSQAQSTDSKDTTMHTHLRELQHEDQGCVFVVRGITKLGFNSQTLLTAHFSKYGEVVRVLVTHSKVKPFRSGPARTTARVRPGSLGFVVMDNPTSVVTILEQGTHQTVGGYAIRVERFHQIKQHLNRQAGSYGGQSELASENSSDSGKCSQSATSSTSAQNTLATPAPGLEPRNAREALTLGGSSNLAASPAGHQEMPTGDLASHFNDLVALMTHTLPNAGISTQPSSLPQPQASAPMLPPSTARVAALVHLLKEEFQQGATLPAQSDASQHHGLPVTWSWPPATSLRTREAGAAAPSPVGLFHEVELYMSQLRGNLQAASSYEQQSALSRLACEQMEAWLQEQREQRENLQHLQRLQQLQQMQQIAQMQRQVEQLAPQLQQIQEVINHVTTAAMGATQMQAAAYIAPRPDFNMVVPDVASLNFFHDGAADSNVSETQYRASGQKVSNSSWKDSDGSWQDQNISSAAARKKVNLKSSGEDAMDKKKTLGMHLAQLQDAIPECVFIARHIGGMGFQSQDLLESHFSKFGKVEKVLVAHSKVKPFRRPGTHSRIRPGSLGFVVMEKKECVDSILALGSEQTVAGYCICVERFEKTAKSMCESGDGIGASLSGDSTTTADSTTPGSGSRSGSGSGSNSNGSEEGSANSGSNGSEEGSDKGNSANSGSNGSEDGSDKGNGSTEDLQKVEGSQGGSEDDHSESSNRTMSPGNKRTGSEAKSSSSPAASGKVTSYR